MDLRIIFLTVFLGSVFAKHEKNIYIPLVKVLTDISEESESQCVTKEYIDGILVNISAMIIEQLKPKPKGCEDLENDNTGIYTIYPYPRAKRNINVRCDMDTVDGGWTVIQKRFSDSDFYKTWDEYKAGFGNLSGNFWLGNRILHMLTGQAAKYELRVDLSNYDGETAYAHYRQFSVGDAESGYRLFVAGYSGTAGDALAWHNGMKFSTYDRDNDAWGEGNCGLNAHGAWWYNACHEANLNGNYGETFSDATGMSWVKWMENHIPVKTSEMKIRRVG